jgi:hypothetical protein
MRIYRKRSPSQPFPPRLGLKPALDLLPLGLKEPLVARHVENREASTVSRWYCKKASSSAMVSLRATRRTWALVSMCRFSHRNRRATPDTVPSVV